MAACGGGYNSNKQTIESTPCYDIVKSEKTVLVPCARNVPEQYTDYIKKRVPYKAQKQVPYQDVEVKTRQVPYTYYGRKTVTKEVPTCRQVPVTREVCCKVPIRSKTPRLVWVDTVRYVNKKCKKTYMQTQRGTTTKKYCQRVPKQGYRTESYNQPVTKYRTEEEVRYREQIIPQTKTRYRRETKIVQKRIPVINVVPRPNAPCNVDRLVKTIRAPDPQPQAAPAQAYVAEQKYEAPAAAAAAYDTGASYAAADSGAQYAAQSSGAQYAAQSSGAQYAAQSSGAQYAAADSGAQYATQNFVAAESKPVDPGAYDLNTGEYKANYWGDQGAAAAQASYSQQDNSGGGGGYAVQQSSGGAYADQGGAYASGGVEAYGGSKYNYDSGAAYGNGSGMQHAEANAASGRTSGNSAHAAPAHATQV